MNPPSASAVSSTVSSSDVPALEPDPNPSAKLPIPDAGNLLVQLDEQRLEALALAALEGHGQRVFELGNARPGTQLLRARAQRAPLDRSPPPCRLGETSPGRAELGEQLAVHDVGCRSLDDELLEHDLEARVLLLQTLADRRIAIPNAHIC